MQARLVIQFRHFDPSGDWPADVVISDDIRAEHLRDIPAACRLLADIFDALYQHLPPEETNGGK